MSLLSWGFIIFNRISKISKHQHQHIYIKFIKRNKQRLVIPLLENKHFFYSFINVFLQMFKL